MDKCNWLSLKALSQLGASNRLIHLNCCNTPAWRNNRNTFIVSPVRDHLTIHIYRDCKSKCGWNHTIEVWQNPSLWSYAGWVRTKIIVSFLTFSFSSQRCSHVIKDLSWNTPVGTDSKDMTTPAAPHTAGEERLTMLCYPTYHSLCCSEANPDRKVNGLVQEELL